MLNYHLSNQSKILLIRLCCLLLEYCLKCLLRSAEYTWELLQYLAAVWRAHTFISPLYQGPHQIKSPMMFCTYGFLCCGSVWPERGLQGIAGNVFQLKSMVYLERWGFWPSELLLPWHTSRRTLCDGLPISVVVFWQCLFQFFKFSSLKRNHELKHWYYRASLGLNFAFRGGKMKFCDLIVTHQKNTKSKEWEMVTDQITQCCRRSRSRKNQREAVSEWNSEIWICKRSCSLILMLWSRRNRIMYAYSTLVMRYTFTIK